MTSNQHSSAALRTCLSRDNTSNGLAGQSSKLGEDAGERGRRAMPTAGDAVTGLRDEGHAALEAARKRAVEYRNRLGSVVPENPAKSALLAMRLGTLLGFFIGCVRRRMGGRRDDSRTR